MDETELAAAAAGGKPGAAGKQADRKVPALKVVAAVDASEESLHALSWALVAVHAQHDADHSVYPLAAHGIAHVPTSALESMRTAREENFRRFVARALDICKEKQVDATAVVVEGDAKEAICQGVERMRAGQLVLGSRGLGKIKRNSASSAPLHL